MGRSLASLLFDDEKQGIDTDASPVGPARRSKEARANAARKRTREDWPVHRFHTLTSSRSCHAGCAWKRNSGRMEVQTHDIPYFLHKLRVLRQLECLAPMWLGIERTPDAANGGGAQSRGLGHPLAALLGCPSGACLQGSYHDLLHIGMRHRPRRTGAGFVQQAVAAVFQEPSPPFPDRDASGRQAVCNLLVTVALG